MENKNLRVKTKICLKTENVNSALAGFSFLWYRILAKADFAL